MRRIINRPVAAEMPGLLGDDLVAEAHGDAVGMGAELNGPPRARLIGRVAVAVEADQARAGQSIRGLMEPVEGRLLNQI